MIAASQKKIADSLLSICESQVRELNGQIKLLNEKDGELKTMYEGQIANLNQQIELYKDQIKGYEKLVRRERFKRRLITFVGIGTTAAAAYLYITK